MIQEFDNEKSANAVPDPKHIWIDYRKGKPVYVVYTGDDIPEPKSQRIISTQAFRERFTDDEIEAVCKLAFGGDVTAQTALIKLGADLELDLDSPRVTGILDYLVSKGVLKSQTVDKARA